MTTTGGRWRRADWPGVRAHGLFAYDLGVALVAGDRDGRPVVARVSVDGVGDELVLPEEAVAAGTVTSLSVSTELVVQGVCGGTVLWRGTPSGGLVPVAVPVDEQAGSAARLWVTRAEEELRVVAGYPRPDGLELRVLDGDPPTLVASPNRLLLLGGADDLRVASDPGVVAVAGPVGDGPGGPALQQWYTRLGWGAPGWHGGAVEVGPDAVTDAVGGSGPVWAGHRDGRALAWHVDGAMCDDLPDVTVAGDHPLVVVARTPVEWGLVLGVQTPAGPRLVGDGFGDLAVPDGLLRAACVSVGFDGPVAFAVVDDRVHVLPPG